MRKLFAAMMILMLMMTAALAEESPGQDFIEAWFHDQYAQLVPFEGLQAAQTREQSAPFGSLNAVCLRLTVEGDLLFGRYIQYVRTALLDAETGEPLPLETVFSDLDALQEFLDGYVEENVREELNTYLDADELLPVPLDTVYFSADGVTLYYPAERFQYFSGHAGAVQLQWYELRGLLVEEPASPLPLAPGGRIDALLEACGSLTDPDLVQGGEIYEFEAPVLRGVQAIADESGLVTAVRYGRFSLSGAEPGMERSNVEALLGAPDAAAEISAAAASYLRLEPGVQAIYPNYTLYYDDAGVLYLLEQSLR